MITCDIGTVCCIRRCFIDVSTVLAGNSCSIPDLILIAKDAGTVLNYKDTSTLLTAAVSSNNIRSFNGASSHIACTYSIVANGIIVF